MENKDAIYSLEAEQSILGSCLISKEAVVSSLEVLNPNDFYRNDNKIVFDAICNLFNKDEAIDIVTVKEELNAFKKLEVVGGLEYLSNLVDIVPTTQNIEKYIRIVKEKSVKRNLINIANQIIEDGYDTSITEEELLANAEKRIFEVSEGTIKKTYRSIKEIMADSIKEIEELHNKKNKLAGISTGFYDLDKKISGLKKSNLMILAARPGMGKSALAMNIAVNVAKKEKKGVLVFNVEMSDIDINNRMISSEGLIDNYKITNGTLEEDDWNKLASAISVLTDLPIYIDDTAGITLQEIRAKCRKLKIEQDIGLVIVDYLQLITPNTKRNGTRENEVAEISRGLKVLAKELKVPVIALSQLSRANEKASRGKEKEVKEPSLSDLRDSGAIEQDADSVIFIHRKAYYDKENIENSNLAKLIIAKNRSGSLGEIELLWRGENTKFSNMYNE